MSGNILISTAYLPPVEFFSLVLPFDELLVESEENYLKQTYRNRCYILSSHGSQILTVPVYLGSLHKTPIKEIRIDYSKRWQQVHLRAITASYGSSPYFQFYFEELQRIVLKDHLFLLDLNDELLELLLKILGLRKDISRTTRFESEGTRGDDLRYKVSPKKPPTRIPEKYPRVFNTDKIIPGISIIDLVFNTGPEAWRYL
jgi:WbqC-like protein family